MNTGRHAAKRRLRWVWVLLTAVVVLLGLLAGAAYAGYRYDRARSSRILPGVRIAGVDLGGMTREQAERALRSPHKVAGRHAR